MAWVFFVVLVSISAAALSSLWWADRPLRSGAALLGVMLLSTLGIAKQAAWGVSEVHSDADQWCLTYDHPDGSSFTECRPGEAEAWAWADALDADLERQYGQREKTTTVGAAYTIVFYACLVGAIACFGWAGIQRRRSNRPRHLEPATT
jgi:hypothetical protein